MLSLVPDPVIHKNPLVNSARGLSLFGELEADAGAVGALGELGDGLDGGSVADLALLLQQVRHLRRVEHQTHALLGLGDVALDGLGSRLESDLTVLGVIGISAAERESYFGYKDRAFLLKHQNYSKILNDVFIILN
jgi:hypothetical protein